MRRREAEAEGVERHHTGGGGGVDGSEEGSGIGSTELVPEWSSREEVSLDVAGPEGLAVAVLSEGSGGEEGSGADREHLRGRIRGRERHRRGGDRAGEERLCWCCGGWTGFGMGTALTEGP